MTSEQLEELLKNIIAGLETGADLASSLAPQIIPFVIIGKAVDKVIPGLVLSVNSWLAGNAPTPQELQDLRDKLSVLSNPDLP